MFIAEISTNSSCGTADDLCRQFSEFGDVNDLSVNVAALTSRIDATIAFTVARSGDIRRNCILESAVNGTIAISIGVGKDIGGTIGE